MNQNFIQLFLRNLQLRIVAWFSISEMLLTGIAWTVQRLSS